MNPRNVIYGVLGVAAFVVGGIVTRSKAIEMGETVEDFFSKKPETDSSE